jgi:hypothetical protein
VPKNDDADDVLAKLSSLEPLEDVPSVVSANFQAKLSELATESRRVKKKSSWMTGANQFALAASFVVVFAFGAVVTLNSGTNSEIPQLASGSSTTDEPLQTDDQLLFSDGDGSPTYSEDVPVNIARSGLDYTQIPTDLYTQLKVGTTWNSVSSLGESDKSCLESLQLDRITNLIDYAKLGENRIRAVWSPVTSSSWYVYLLDESCTAIDKKYFEKQ